MSNYGWRQVYENPALGEAVASSLRGAVISALRRNSEWLEGQKIPRARQDPLMFEYDRAPEYDKGEVGLFQSPTGKIVATITNEGLDGLALQFEGEPVHKEGKISKIWHDTLDFIYYTHRKHFPPKQ